MNSTYGDTWVWRDSGWRQVTRSGPSKRTGAMMAPHPDGSVLLYGSADDHRRYDDTWRLDGTAWTHLQTGSPPGPLAFGAMAYDPARDRVILFDGDAATPRTWAWADGAGSEIGSVGPSHRFPRTLGWDPRREALVLALDGSFASDLLFDDVWVLDGSGWRALPPPPTTWAPRPARPT